MKENSWLEIAELLQLSVNQCQLRWTRLRERYIQKKENKGEMRQKVGVENQIE